MRGPHSPLRDRDAEKEYRATSGFNRRLRLEMVRVQILELPHL